jgi:hypothetical protein
MVQFKRLSRRDTLRMTGLGIVTRTAGCLDALGFGSDSGAGPDPVGLSGGAFDYQGGETAYMPSPTATGKGRITASATVVGVVDNLDIDPGDTDAGELCLDVLAGSLERALAAVEPAGHRRLEGDLYLPTLDPLGVAAALDLVELVAHPDVRRAVVWRPPVVRWLLALLIDGAGECCVAAPAPNE